MNIHRSRLSRHARLVRGTSRAFLRVAHFSVYGQCSNKGAFLGSASLNAVIEGSAFCDLPNLTPEEDSYEQIAGMAPTWGLNCIGKRRIFAAWSRDHNVS
jgi:hypothetical protein